MSEKTDDKHLYRGIVGADSDTNAGLVRLLAVIMLFTTVGGAARLFS